jgi:hypothetical protein
MGECDPRHGFHGAKMSRPFRQVKPKHTSFVMRQ